MSRNYILYQKPPVQEQPPPSREQLHRYQAWNCGAGIHSRIPGALSLKKSSWHLLQEAGHIIISHGRSFYFNNDGTCKKVRYNVGCPQIRAKLLFDHAIQSIRVPFVYVIKAILEKDFSGAAIKHAQSCSYH